MCGKMERFFFRPLQIAIVIQVLSPTILCIPIKLDVKDSTPLSTGKCGAKMDLAFFVKEPSSICDGGYRTIQGPDPCGSWQSSCQLIHDVVDELDIGEDATQVSTVVFSTSAKVKFWLYTITDKAQLLSAIDTMATATGSTGTSSPLDTVAKQVFAANAGGRSDANNTVIVITDGMSTVDDDQLTKSLAALSDKGIRILEVGMNSPLDQKSIRDISSAPHKLGENYFLAANYDQLKDVAKNVVETLKQGICKPDSGEKTATDVVSRVEDPRCFKTNYQGPVSDLRTAPNGVIWDYKIANFGFDWPQAGIVNLPLSNLVYIDSITFKSSDNLDYFRVVITKNNGNKITTNAIGPNDRSTSLRNANNVKRVDFYLAPVDFRRNVSLNNVNIKACTQPGGLRSCTLFNLLKDLILTASLGIIKPGGSSGTFSASAAPEYPFVELDLNCAGLGTVGFNGVSFGRTSNFNNVVTSVWDGAVAVPIVNKDGVAGVNKAVSSYAQGINFANNVRGNRIRATIIPAGVPNLGISGSIWFSKYSVLGV